MKLNFEKWLNNKTDANFKRIFNDNVDKLNKIYQYFKIRDESTNSRINNLILRSGGNSPNEVVDARVDFEGKVHDTLKDRLDSDSKSNTDKLISFEELLNSYESKVSYLEKQLQLLYSQYNETITYRVSNERGNDLTGDGTEEKPFKTIQKAINTIPKISAAGYIVVLDKGSYLEDVSIDNFKVNRITIQSSNLSVLEGNPSDTGHYVRKISFVGCDGYTSCEGLTCVDSANTNRAISFDRCAYGVVNKCPINENNKTKDYVGLYYSASRGHAYSNNISNQKTAISVNYASNVAISLSNGSNNTTGIIADRSIVYDSVTDTLTGERVKMKGGQIF
ncbi:MAG: hypothetical protein RR494_02585 [Vagococcus sp.]|uniref:hypothetical protein n=1 Tax=Vagococcus sp. TaxID=1933889 RepID=UPI002FCA6571